jgi:hypothetical protein
MLRMFVAFVTTARVLPPDQVGYTSCLSTEQSPSPVPVLEHLCLKKPAGVVSCGQKVGVVRTEVEWLRIRLTEGSVRYAGHNLCIQRPERVPPFPAFE